TLKFRKWHVWDLKINTLFLQLVMSRRLRGDRIAVWVRDKDNVPVINGIGYVFPVCVTSFSWALANNNHYITIRLFYVVYRKRLLKILDLLDEKGIGMDFQVRMK